MNFLVETNRGQDVSPRTPASSKTLDIVDPELEAKLAYFASFIENYVVELMDVYPNQITKTQIRNLCFRPINLVNARENRKSPRRSSRGRRQAEGQIPVPFMGTQVIN